uniref:Ribosome-binding factor A, mitochondrial n=1 Tax=Graphocephala atropunctata TaxID=36148 RepID=A0A1B6KVE5_9HEMI
MYSFGMAMLFANHGKLLNCLFMNSTRKLSLNCAPEMNKYVSREANMLSKLIGMPKKRRKTYFDGTTVPSGGGKLNMDGGIKSSKENSRRIAVLNTLFMKYISDLLVTGNIAEDVLGKGLEISRVAMTSNFNQLNVFWGTNNEENSAALEKVLPQVGFTLRHELSQLRVMGVVPRIVFMKDKQLSSAMKVDHLLSVADFGEDHEPIPLGSEFKNAVPVGDMISQTVKDDADKDESTETEEQAQLGEVMPVMRQDIFNLDHDSIMRKVTKSLHKSRALHRFQPNLEIDCKGLEPNWGQVPVEKMTKQERKEALSKFILERKVIQEKQRRNKYNSELNVFSNDSRGTADEDDYDSEDFETQHFIEEFVEEEKYKEKN